MARITSRYSMDSAIAPDRHSAAAERVGLVPDRLACRPGRPSRTVMNWKICDASGSMSLKVRAL